MTTKTAAVVLLAFLMSTPLVLAEPDYTTGEMCPNRGPHEHEPWSLGPTGAHGDIRAKRESQTEDTRMILIKRVDTGTPADGKREEGDAIIGLGSSRFQSDVRQALSAVVTEAEKEENGGTLTLKDWRPFDRFDAFTADGASTSARATAGQARQEQQDHPGGGL